jgi:hypothetical protein
VCDGCGKPADNGYLYVTYAAIHEYEVQKSEWDAAHPPGQALSLTGLFDHPEPARWWLMHRRCDPQPDADSYWIDLERINTWERLVHWTAHLMEKNWLASTDWQRLLQGAEYGNTRLSAQLARV